MVRSRDRHGEILRSVVCRRCGLVWTDPRPAPEETRRFYAEEYRLAYKGSDRPKPKHVYRSGKVAVARARELLLHLKSGDRLLDVGAGGGELVYVLRALGLDASGIEPHEGYARHAAESLGVQVRQGTWEDASIEPESLDAVTMFHVAEHCESPSALFRRVRRWLRTEALLWVEVPNVEAVCQHPSTDFHRAHLYHFNGATLATMGRRAGFAVVGNATSRDGGNLTVAFRKREIREATTGEIAGNYERVASILRGHTLIRHYSTRHPYVRPLRKAAAFWEEQRSLRSTSSPKALLDALIAGSAAVRRNR